MDAALATLVHANSLPALLRYLDRNGMAWSVEPRVPFLDRRVTAASKALGGADRFRDGVGKSVLRDARWSRLPPLVAARRDKLAFSTPERAWWRGPLRTWAADVLDPVAVRRHGVLDPAVVGRVRDGLHRGVGRTARRPVALDQHRALDAVAANGAPRGPPDEARRHPRVLVSAAARHRIAAPGQAGEVPALLRLDADGDYRRARMPPLSGAAARSGAARSRRRATAPAIARGTHGWRGARATARRPIWSGSPSTTSAPPAASVCARCTSSISSSCRFPTKRGPGSSMTRRSSGWRVSRAQRPSSARRRPRRRTAGGPVVAAARDSLAGRPA